MFFICLCLAVAVVFPRLSPSYELVNDEGCLECHDFGGLHTISGHTDCATCHATASGGGAVQASNCLACHPRPLVGAETCDLVGFHEDNPDYMPEGDSCLSMGCHSDDCNGRSTTTTTVSNTTTSSGEHLSISRNLWGRFPGGYTPESSP